jgi:hypothetical protein
MNARVVKTQPNMPKIIANITADEPLGGKKGKG